MKLTADDLSGLEQIAGSRAGSMLWRYSQTGEDAILVHLFTRLGITRGYLVDIGAGDGWHFSNARLLLHYGWAGLLFDVEEHVGVEHERITDDNVNDVLDLCRAPADLDLLLLDIDGQDWWVWRALTRRPKIVVVEVNGNIPAEPARTVGRYPPWDWDRTVYYGASFGAFARLGHAKGYTLVHNQKNLNLFFVRNDLIEPGFNIAVPFEVSVGHPPDEQNREWHYLTEEDLTDVPGGVPPVDGSAP